MSRRTLAISYAFWSLFALGFVAVLLLERFLATCELVPGSSYFGQASYSVLGLTCTYSVEGLTYVQRPPLARLPLGVLLVAWPCVTYAAARRGRQARASAQV